MKTATVNINKCVKVKVNEFDLSVMKSQREKLQALASSLPDFTHPAVDSEGYSKFQKWELMQTFGPVLYLSGELPFDIEIHFTNVAITEVAE